MATRSVPDLGIEYDLWGEYPVQALGQIRGREFYFRAKHSEWEFEVADADGVLPSDGGKPEFVRRGKHPDASHMPHDEAASLIDSFLREYTAAAAVD
jgi:hypothetical protein